MPDHDETRSAPDQPELTQSASGPDPLASPPAGTVVASPEQNRQAAAQSVPDGVVTVPGYETQGELGRGGMGVVYKARDTRLNREVALKMILWADASFATKARFWAEAEVMAAVKHPHVVQVYELGEHAGRPFMAMEYVAGGNLADILKTSGGSPLPPMGAATIVEKIARGVAAAHHLGIIHRDLKPANVLLDENREPKVSDFGLAKWRSTDLTATQAMMGTPAYMSPEQASGRAKFVGPQTDVWALGVLLYQCVAGQRPFEGGTTEVLLSQIQSADPVSLRARVQGVPRDLETIASKCLRKQPERRYATAGELADDLGRFVRGEPILARPMSMWEKADRYIKRLPETSAWGLVILCVGIALSVLLATSWQFAAGVLILAPAGYAGMKTGWRAFALGVFGSL